MAKRFLIFQHMPWEGPGEHLVRSAESQGLHLDVIEVWHQAIPDLANYDGLIVLGGSPNVDQEEEYPFLRGEKAAIRAVLAADQPYLGFCLGHQLLADVLGLDVGPNSCRSVGFIEGHLTKDGRQHPLFQNLPNTMPLFKWHGQAVLSPVPKHIEILVTSLECEIEAISLRGSPHIIGLQFDNHAGSKKDVTTWIEGDRAWLSNPPEVETSVVLAEAVKHETHVGEQFELVFNNYLNLIP
ncbi:MAG: type 1 glutamine amidotransferase [Deltaproteobacteria bacterium]|nr:MAG: type 1 glutamine amidotransferase [Deltaproteobacteria bacterium]